MRRKLPHFQRQEKVLVRAATRSSSGTDNTAQARGHGIKRRRKGLDFLDAADMRLNPGSPPPIRSAVRAN
jgi:hypothetical protein